jgi:hypothetical protein
LSRNDQRTWRLDWHSEREFQNPQPERLTREPVLFTASDVEGAMGVSNDATIIAYAEHLIQRAGASATSRLALQGAIAAWSLTWPDPLLSSQPGGVSETRG